MGRRSSSPGTAGAGDDTALAPRHTLTHDPQAVTHLVCCRAERWDVALCGFTLTGGAVNNAGDSCAMCVHQARAAWAARGQAVLDEHCALDGTACPDDAWIMDRLARETS